MRDAVTAEPEPPDNTYERLLNDPEIRASIDEQVAALERGDLKTYSAQEVREHLRRRGVPLRDAPTQG